MKSQIRTLSLNNTIHNTVIPIIGLGTWLLERELVDILPTAFRLGFSLVDSAVDYENEEYIGQVFDTGSMKRDDFFLCTKLHIRDMHSREAVRRSVNESLANLRTDYIDLYLVHFPGAEHLDPSDPRNAECRRHVWEELEQLYKSGKVLSIGVSNYEPRHLRELLAHAAVRPAVLQSEYHPLIAARQSPLIELCRAEHIVFEAYSSLGGDSPDNNRLLLAHPAVRRIASCHTHGETGAFSSLSSSSACTTVSRSEAESSDADFECSSAATGSMGTGAAVTPAQVLLRFAVQDDIVVIPKASSEGHLMQNVSLFDFALTPAEMAELAALPEQLGFRRFDWDPTQVA